MDKYIGGPPEAFDDENEYNAALQVSEVKIALAIDQMTQAGLRSVIGELGPRVTIRSLGTLAENIAKGRKAPWVDLSLDLLDGLYGVRSDDSRTHLKTPREHLGGIAIGDLIDGGMIDEALYEVNNDVRTGTFLNLPETD